MIPIERLHGPGSATVSPRSRLQNRFHQTRPFATIMHIYYAERWRVLVSYISFIIKASPVWVMPLLTANIIDLMLQRATAPITGLWINGGVMIFFLLQNIPTNYVFARTLSVSARSGEANLRMVMAVRLQQLRMRVYSETSLGAIQNKMLRDVESIDTFLRQSYEGVVAPLCSITIAVIATATRAPQFLLFFLVTVPIAAILMFCMNRRLVNSNHALRSALEQMSSGTAEMVQLMAITRAHAIEPEAVRRFETQVQLVRAAGEELDSTSAWFGASSWVLFNTLSTCCLMVAAWTYYTQRLDISAGDVVLLSGYFASLTGAALALAGVWPAAGKAFEAVRSIGSILGETDVEDYDDKIRVTDVQGAFRFDDVSVMYPVGTAHVNDGDDDESGLWSGLPHRLGDMTVPALSRFTLTVSATETIGIVGESGAGKSTLLNVILGFITPTSGRVLLDGRDMTALDLRTYRTFVSVVPQEIVLFSGSVRENVAFGLDTPSHEVTDAQVMDALRIANALSFVEALPHGLDTQLGEHGSRLSGGQRQRIGIARAALRNPRVLILDEATAALDSHTEAAVLDAMKTLMRGRTIFIVAHRMATVRAVDRVVVLHRGAILECGSHTELLAREGKYAQLCRMQMIA
eukprot:TRINITY_DN15628_c0_g1_i1.p1 TRINITY_DN15628_c0_g1~~TRINITY_DN15628_c0_g1_i1.p1  ORF type:complete len:634 (-),score=145.91 TRINITY_DN15628_c0_g1_i1:407-2308(-)